MSWLALAIAGLAAAGLLFAFAFRNLSGVLFPDEAVRVSEERLLRLLEVAQEGVVVVRPDGAVDYANPQAAGLVGVNDPAALRGRRLSDQAAAGRSAAKLDAALNAADRTEAPFELTLRSGRNVAVTLETLRDDRGKPAGALVTLRDVTAEWRARAELKSALTATVRALAATLEQRDPYTAGHQVRVAALAEAIARHLGWPDWRAEALNLAAAVHDIGKIAVPAELLLRTERLSPAEFGVVQGHVAAGLEIVSGIPGNLPLAEVVGQHHERLDGSGYPLGLKGDQISSEARIVAVADVVEAMTSPRAWREAHTLDAALAELDAGRDTRFDAEAVDACRAVWAAGFAWERDDR